MRLLVVNHRSGFAERLALPLRQAGHEVEIAADDLSALRLARANPAVVLVDMATQDTSGYALAKSIHEQAAWRRPFLVAITNGPDADGDQRIVEAGFDLRLAEPVDPGRLLLLLCRFGTIVEEVLAFDPAI